MTPLHRVGLMATAYCVLTVQATSQRFPDAPVGHWVYEALAEGRNRGHFFGYPDGWFRGGSSVSRYELAGVVNAFYQDMRQQVMTINDQLMRWQVFPGGPLPETPIELRRSIAAVNWVLENRRALREFAYRLGPAR